MNNAERFWPLIGLWYNRVLNVAASGKLSSVNSVLIARRVVVSVTSYLTTDLFTSISRCLDDAYPIYLFLPAPAELPISKVKMFAILESRNARLQQGIAIYRWCHVV